MKEQKIKTALIGLGNIGMKCDYYNKNIVSHAKAISHNNDLQFTCAIDRNIKNVNKFKKKYKIPASTKTNNILEQHKPNFIIIAVKKEESYKIINNLKNYDFVKYILLEKPGAKNNIELKKIIKICIKKKIKLFINYNRTFQQKYLDIFLEYKKAKKFKSVYLYNRGLYNNCSHYLNLLSQFLNMPKKIEILSNNPNWNNDIQPDVKLKYKNGEVLLINMGVKNLFHNQFFMTSNTKKILSDNYFANVKIYNKKNNNYIFDKDIDVQHNFTQAHSLSYILKIIRSKKNIKNLLSKYIETGKILDKIKQLYNKK